MPAAETTRSTNEHDWHSSEYVDWWITRDRGRDAERRQRLQKMLAHADAPPNAKFSVIDIGGGYGVVTEEVVAAFPRARVTLQDYSEPMILAARERLIAHSECINYVLADLTDQGWVDRVLSVGGGPFDLAVSAIVIHNLRQAPLIAHAYSGVARMLKPGGLFLDYDLFSTRSAAWPATYSSCTRLASHGLIVCGSSPRWQRSQLGRTFNRWMRYANLRSAC